MSFRKVMLASRVGALAISLAVFSAPSFAAVTNMTLVGGCPESENGPECFSAGNATTTNVALLVGVAETDVTQIFSGFTVDGLSPPDTDDYSDFFNTDSGSWEVSDSSITHLAFKADGYFILGTVDGASGDWSTDITMWSPDVTTLTCPVGICAVERDYTVADFLNGGTNIADLSNIRAFSVVPIPAAVWLFGSALAGLGGLMRVRKVTA